MVNGCLRLSNVSVICNVVSPRRTSQKIWGGFLYGVYGQMNYSELIPTVKMETRNPVERFFGSKFPVNCNLYAVMAAWSRKTFKFLINFCVFRKTTAYGEIFKILFRKFSSRLRPMCCVQISWNLAYGKSVKSCVAYSTKKKQKFAWLFSCRYCADHVQNLCWSAPNNVLGVLQISSKSAHFRWSYSRPRDHRQNVP